jgi:glycosyltransferase involved in cell wall biosynthesis
MTGSAPQFSVAMATYNGGAFLREQLASLGTQTLLPAELVVGDDGSSDDTMKILDEFRVVAPFPVSIQRNDRPLGYGENFIRTATRCSGEWIAFCDQDDVWLPGKLSGCAAAVESGPADLRLIVHEAEVVDQNLHPKRLLYGRTGDVLHPPLSLPPDWFCLGLTQVFSARLIREFPNSPRLSFPWHKHREAHDVWIALLANATGSVLLKAEPLVRYRRHEAAVTGAAKPGQGERLASLLRNSGAQFSQRAEYLRNLALRLNQLAASAPDDNLRQRLSTAGGEVEKYAERMGRRAAVYLAPHPFAAASRVAAFALRGGYGERPWPIGTARGFKDLAAASASTMPGVKRRS